MKDWELTKQFHSSFGSIQYDIEGEGPAIVLVHGTPWSSYNWRHLIPALRQWFTVYYYDLLGYGQSEKIDGADISLGVQNKVLAELLDHWGLQSPMVIGHDFGGTTVLRTHLLDKRDFQKIILVDPVAIGPWGSPFFAHVNQHEEAFKGIPAYIHESIVSTYVQGAQFKPMSGETLKGIIKPWLGGTGQNAFYRQMAQANQKYTDEIEPLYGNITTPTLIIWGEEDEWIPMKKGHILHGKIKGSLLETIPNTGHLVQEDSPTVLLAYLVNFLR
ncbi:pimeloyl-ACP methyl ester carboxylesterase [Salibacterium salarium]|uniref:alpha/beta fold hydrolase n=1 Tax=Salibacterium salarium TaxID=284579 RepID=UPI002783EC8E|nr:alpha/beta hydrolase [Salibacterium salarium]MDQ0300298.1 pimeloyl-ACP methyl ester carboxylesterase [Salibacterium salarium]